MTSRRAATERCDHGFLKSEAHRICPECSSAPKLIAVELPADLTGLVFGKLKVDGPAQAGSQSSWSCTCTCGRQVTINRSSIRKALRNGYTSACPDCRSYTPKPKEQEASA